MKRQKPIILNLPELLIQELDKYLMSNPPNFKYEVMYFYYIIHYVITTRIKAKKKKFIFINKAYLKEVAASNIGRYITILKDSGILIADKEKPIPGKESIYYKLNPIYLEGNIKVEIKPGSKLFDKIIDYNRRKRAHFYRLEPFLKEMKNAFMNIELNYEEAEQWISDKADEDKKSLYNTTLNNIKDKRFRYFHRNTTNKRLDTNLTNIKTEIRGFLKGDYLNIDLKNSQPFLLSLLINKITNKHEGTLCHLFDDAFLIKTFGSKAIQKIQSFHQNKENLGLVNLKQFTDSTRNGSFYDDFIRSYDEPITRDKVKEIMFGVMFSENRNIKGYVPYSKDKKNFIKVYPFVYKAIEQLKSLNHKALAIFLQKLESYIFIDCIAKELVEAGIVPLTIHDSMIVKKEDQIQATSIMENVFFKKFGVIPTFKPEPLKPQDIDDENSDLADNSDTSLLRA